MNNKNKAIVVHIIGVYFLVLGIVAIIRSMYHHAPTQILYACYMGMILIGVGILARRSFIVLSQIYILAIPLFVWDIDFVHWLIFNRSLLGVTDYFFLEFSANIDKFVMLQHLYTIPLAIYAVILIGVGRKDAWKWSFIQLVLLFVAVMVFSAPSSNINCMFYSCIDVNFGVLPYTFVWFSVVFCATGISVLLLNYFLWPKTRNNVK